MTNHELKQLRKLLFLDVTEAAKHIGEVEPRTWQRWEDGSRKVPRDVADNMAMMALTRLERLSLEHDENDADYRYFDTYEEYQKSGGTGGVIHWRLAQSVATEMMCERYAAMWREAETIQEER